MELAALTIGRLFGAEHLARESLCRHVNKRTFDKQIVQAKIEKLLDDMQMSPEQVRPHARKRSKLNHAETLGWYIETESEARSLHKKLVNTVWIVREKELASKPGRGRVQARK